MPPSLYLFFTIATAAVNEIRPPPYGGFDSITRQIEYKPLKRGFQFNVAVGRFEYDEPVRQTTEIQAVSHVVVENGVRLRPNIVDTPGYGDQISNEVPASAYLWKELTAMRDKHIQDTRIHCCLFFINPTEPSLRSIDIIVMKKLCEVVNVNNIRTEMKYNNTRLYPLDTDENDPEELALNETIRNIIPFAVVGSERNVLIDGKPVRGRKNKWGVINVEDETHCEFVHLRNFLTRTHLQDLIETTAQIHCEAFRSKQLLALKDASARPAQGSA
ncbi:cell division control protein [Tulasnella sp. 425]|nr:cell division control protein [Tulasnella sp. 425]